MYRLGMDIGGTKINIGILDDDCRLLATKKLYIKDITDFTKQICDETETLCMEAGISVFDIAACGIGVPGTVSADGKKLLKAPNITVLPENVAEELEKALGAEVCLVQDSRAAAWGEYLCGAGKGADTVVCLTLGTGIGTGIVMNGKIYDGALGSAGELGHVCAVPDGRPCGCGKSGCMEKYCAGMGLDMTAAELLGEGKTAKDLFEAAEENPDARAEIDKAIVLLGNAVVSVVNMLSPDAILFSGGLSDRGEEYVNPVIQYVKDHCYSAGTFPKLAKAELGGFAPLIGAALIPRALECKKDNTKTRKPLLSASVMCADVLHLGKAVEEIEDAGIQYLHCDIMDNHFVPNLMLPMELLNQLHENSVIPFDYHIMAENPDTVLEKLSLKKADYVSVHAESTPHLQKAITAIKEKGAMASVAINPATPIEMLRDVLPQLDMVLVMTVNPGFAGQKIVPGAFDKIRRVRKYLDELGFSNIKIQVDGNCSFENVPKMYEAGAEIFVVGTSSVFKKEHTIREGTKKLYDTLQ